MPLKAVVLRVVGFGLAAWLATEWWAGRWRRPEPAGLAALAFAAVTVLSGALSHAPRLAWAGEVAQREGVLTVLALVALHLAAAHAHRSAAQVRTTLRVLLVSAVVAAAYAQLQLAGLDPIAWDGVHTVTSASGMVLRPAGPLGSPVLLGVVLAAALPIVLAGLADDAEDAVWGVPVGALLAAGLLLTMSRGAWLAGAVGSAVAIVCSLLAGARPWRVAWTVGASLSPAVVFAFTRASASIAARLGESVDSGSTAAHAQIARGALQLWSERPWLGHGPDLFGVAFARVQDPELWRAEWVGLPIHAHSAPLQVLATTGAFGALAGLAWLGAGGWALLRAWREAPAERPWLAGVVGAGAALIAVGLVDVVGLAGAASFAILSALPAAAHARAPLASLPAHPKRRALRASLPLALALIVAGTELLSGTLELTALAQANVAREARVRGDRTPSEWRALTESEALALERASKTWPHDDLLWRVASASALQAAGTAEPAAAARWRVGAEQSARRAIALAPERAAAWGSLADALAARALASGEAATADSATRAYERAVALAPADGWLLVAHARFQLARRDGVRALEVAQRLTGLYPEAAVGHTLAGAALLLQRRTGEARVAFEQSLVSRWESDALAQRESVVALVGHLPVGVVATPDNERPRVPRRPHR